YNLNQKLPSSPVESLFYSDFSTVLCGHFCRMVYQELPRQPLSLLTRPFPSFAEQVGLLNPGCKLPALCQLQKRYLHHVCCAADKSFGQTHFVILVRLFSPGVWSMRSSLQQLQSWY